MGPDLQLITEDPPNASVPVGTLTGEPLSQDRMYVRCSFPFPQKPPSGFEVVVPGRESRWVAADSLPELPQVEVSMVLECAGNGRTLMNPVPDGLAWELGGVSPITVGGVPLTHVLGDLAEDVSEVVFTGADSGRVNPQGHVHYQFSISRDLAVSNVPVLATHIGGEPLTLPHGAPVRLIVPGHYAMKSVKWLARIEAVTEPFRGHFVERYRYFGDDTEPEGEPVGSIAVRSLIASPDDGEEIPAGPMEVRGSAWSGASPVSTVEVSVDGGQTWRTADLGEQSPSNPWAAVPWKITVEVGPESHEVMARARDLTGAVQPMQPRWNALGYANNLVHQVQIAVRE